MSSETITTVATVEAPATGAKSATSSAPARKPAQTSSSGKRTAKASAPAKGTKKGAKAAPANGKPSTVSPTAEAIVSGKPRQKLWNTKRILIVKALQKLGAVSEDTSVPATEIVKKAGKDLSEHNVARYCSEGEPLVEEGLIRRAKMEGMPMHYYLTAKGKKTTPPA